MDGESEILWCDKRNIDCYLENGYFLNDNMSNIQVGILFESIIKRKEEELKKLK